MRTIIFDLDGTLYEDERVYDRYVKEMASRIPAAHRAAFFEDWATARTGASPVRIGLGYDADRDRLFRYDGNRITQYVDWHDRIEPVPPPPSPDETAQDPLPPTETEIFGPGRYNNGDWWGVASTIAAHHGIPRGAMRDAFMATREYMHADDFDLRVDIQLMSLIRRFHGTHIRLIAMSNSPTDSVEIVIHRLGIYDCFERIIGMAGKPPGLTTLLQEIGCPGDILSVGDNFVNDIRPALDHGSAALYIDRHDSRLGADSPLCHLVPSINAARLWLERRYL